LPLQKIKFMYSKNLHVNKWRWSFILLLLSSFASIIVEAQTVITSSDISVPAGNDAPMAVAFHPVYQRYYASSGGGGGSTVATSTSAGVLIGTTSHNFDNRGLWYNSTTNRIEGSRFSADIIGYYPMDVNGTLNGNVVTITTGSFSTDGQQGATYNSAANEYLIRVTSGSNIVRRYSVTGSLLGTITVNFPSGSNFQTNHVQYTGIAGRELGFYDYTNKRFYTFSIAGGNFSHYYQLPATAPAISTWGFSYANGRVFLHNGSLWLGYPVQVCTPPTITSTTSSNRCGTGTLTLTAAASAGTINWYASATGGTSLATGTSFITPSLNSTTTYYVDATLNGCSSARTAVTATVGSGPVINVQPASTSVCQGASSTLTVSSTGTGTITYQWRKNGVNINGANTNTYAINNMSASDTGSYSVVITDSCSSLTSSIALVSLNTVAAPTVANGSICASSGSLTLTNTSTVPSGYNTKWYDNAALTTLLSTGTSYTRTYTVTDTLYVRNEATGTLLSGVNAIDHNNLTGDDRGGIAVTQDFVYYFGDNNIARYNASNLTGARQLPLHATLFATYGANGTLYSFGNATGPFVGTSAGTATHLWRVDTGLTTIAGSSVALSASVNFSGILAPGPDFVIIGGSTLVKVNTLTGAVTTLTTGASALSPNGSESWGAYGFATLEGGNHYITYRPSSLYNAGIAKFHVEGNTNTPVFDPVNPNGFSVFSDMAAIAYSPWNSRVYFHHEGGTSYTAYSNCNSWFSIKYYINYASKPLWNRHSNFNSCCKCRYY